MIHPARKIGFNELVEGLEAAQAAGLVARRDSPNGRSLYVYTSRCVYENAWNDFALIARGLILHHGERRVVATPFPKFFNAGERDGAIPDLPFEVFEKVDGSLGIIHYFKGAWWTSTKGAFDSPQAVWVGNRLTAHDLSPLTPGTTYLVEAIYPANRIVVRYDTAELVLLGAYLEDGTEMSPDALAALAERLGWRTVKRHTFASFADLVEHARILPLTQEGFVIRFSNGLRLKLKGDEYRRIHALISRCTPLAMWEAMSAGDDMTAIRRDLPEEFWADFDAITATLAARMEKIKCTVAATADALSSLSDKEVGLRLRTLDPEVRPFIFHWRKAGGKLEGRSLETLYRAIRPTGNVLPGYTPSYAMNRVIDESA